MLTQLNKRSIVIIAVLTVGAFAPRAVIAGCPCNGDVNNVSGINAIDVAIANDCAAGDCSQCVNDCDVNCDGANDFIDTGVIACEAQGGADCCNRPTGACTGATGMTPCAVTLVEGCNLLSGTYHGDATICDGDNVIAIPAASEWGLVALALAILVSATVLIRARRRPCTD
jgi:hypothetical protein